MEDSRYANDRSTSVAAFKVLENDLKKLLPYIEPNDLNKSVFSHRLYELFLRASTEFESNCKKILIANDYASSRDLNITDYFKIARATKLHEYQIKINIWNPSPLVIQPFLDWNTTRYQPLQWYRDYNSVKHNRHDNFICANLENVVLSISAVYILLFAQFDHQAMANYNDISSYTSDQDDFIYTSDSILSINCPNWDSRDSYSFDWNILKNDINPFEKYSF